MGDVQKAKNLYREALLIKKKVRFKVGQVLHAWDRQTWLSSSDQGGGYIRICTYHCVLLPALTYALSPTPLHHTYTSHIHIHKHIKVEDENRELKQELEALKRTLDQYAGVSSSNSYVLTDEDEVIAGTGGGLSAPPTCMYYVFLFLSWSWSWYGRVGEQSLYLSIYLIYTILYLSKLICWYLSWSVFSSALESPCILLPRHLIPLSSHIT